MNKIALITGAGKGIGRALVEKMLDNDFYVIGTNRSGKIEGFDTMNFHAMQLDLSIPSSIENAHKEIFTNFKKIDILINNAGIGPDLDTVLPQKESFKQTFEVNVTGTVFFTEPLIDLINTNGKILNISSKMGSIEHCEHIDSVAYRMSKSALNMYSKILTNRLENRIKVASIHPGWVVTNISENSSKNGRLTSKQSAENIYNFIKKDFKSGTFWGSENETELLW
ncbi:SDR family NAD(P)-dependent oxidoreductase [Aquimarina aquimarini]|uniref:SDR family NAD(P)-dependent oxidoreductase n=1 Tax=Aquimarina aquimarini TaxID=1191734 RepID=UPI000D557DF6|nr:SDR family NAD(P)-dependent oxidoreductase [Aquimarina aquimarini]